MGLYAPLWLFAVTTLVAAKNPWLEPRTLVFGNDRDWVLVNARTYSAQRIHVPRDRTANTLTATADGKRVVFSSFDDQAHNVLLFSYEVQAPNDVRRIGDVRGYHSDPAITPDGTWVYFAHHPNAGGPPGQHGEKAYAQIYRAHLDGTGLEAMTNEPGCHFAPNATGRTAASVFFIHTTCSVERYLVRMDERNRSFEQVSTVLPMGLDEPYQSPDGKHLLYTVIGVSTLEVDELATDTSKSIKVASFSRSETRAHPQYGSRRAEVLYQSLNEILLLNGGVSKRFMSFLENVR
jgi:hypothetical protein